MSTDLTPSLRGEITLVIAGRPYNLRPTFSELTRLEKATGLILTEIVDAVAKRKTSLDLIAKIIACGLAGGKSVNPTTNLPWSADEVGDAMVGDLMPFFLAAGNLVVGSVSGGKGAEAQAPGKAETGTPT